MSDSLRLYCPADAAQMTENDVWLFFENIARELSLLDLTQPERAAFAGYYSSAGLLRGWRRPFFRHHYVAPLLNALRAIFGTTARPRILDLGCGSGTQSLLFALLGAEVVSVDMDEVALAVLHKRSALYQQNCGRPLQLAARSGNVFEMDFEALGPFDAVYSLFAFNMMQPTSRLLERLSPHLQRRAVLAIQDGNRAHFFNRVFRPRKQVSSRDELRQLLRTAGFTDVRHIGGYAIPPPLWRLVSARVLRPLDRLFARSELLAVSYLHLARRDG